MEEPLLKERSDRFVLFPIEDDDVSVLPEMFFFIHALYIKLTHNHTSPLPNPTQQTLKDMANV